jgi:hypothetical protein
MRRKLATNLSGRDRALGYGGPSNTTSTSLTLRWGWANCACPPVAYELVDDAISGLTHRAVRTHLPGKTAG